MAEDVSENYREIPGPQLSTVVSFAGLLTESHLRLLQTVTKIHLCVFTFPPLATIFGLALNECNAANYSTINDHSDTTWRVPPRYHVMSGGTVTSCRLLSKEGTELFKKLSWERWLHSHGPDKRPSCPPVCICAELPPPVNKLTFFFLNWQHKYETVKLCLFATPSSTSHWLLRSKANNGVFLFSARVYFTGDMSALVIPPGAS